MNIDKDLQNMMSRKPLRDGKFVDVNPSRYQNNTQDLASPKAIRSPVKKKKKNTVTKHKLDNVPSMYFVPTLNNTKVS